MFKVYGYCLMDTHGHLMIDANGADISKFMHVINQCYAQYYNKRYKRRGHLFQDRFKSKIVEDDVYLLTLSGYIHNNPRAIKGYKDCVEIYPYSSLGIYLGIHEDKYKIVDPEFTLQFFSRNDIKSKELYLKFVYACENEDVKKEIEFKNERGQYRSERKILVRNFNPEDIIRFVSKHVSIDFNEIYIKNRKSTEFKGVCIFLMRTFCNYTHKQICEAVGNITEGSISRLCSVGYRCVKEDERYKNIIELLLRRAAA